MTVYKRACKVQNTSHFVFILPLKMLYFHFPFIVMCLEKSFLAVQTE